MALNETQDLENELRASGSEYTDLDFNRKLQQANERLTSLVGRRFIERKTIRFEDEQVVDLDFQNLESFDKVYNVSDDDIVDSSNYTEDLSNGTVDFDQSYVDDNFFEGLTLVFYYTPSSFKTLELDLAKRNILELETVVTGDEVTNTRVQRLNQRITAKVSEINHRNSTGVQRGDSENRGSEDAGGFVSNG